MKTLLRITSLFVLMLAFTFTFKSSAGEAPLKYPDQGTSILEIQLEDMNVNAPIYITNSLDISEFEFISISYIDNIVKVDNIDHGNIQIEKREKKNKVITSGGDYRIWYSIETLYDCKSDVICQKSEFDDTYSVKSTSWWKEQYFPRTTS